MAEIIKGELIYFWYYFSIQFEQIVWYWILGMALGSLVSVFGKEKIHTLFIKMRNTKMGVFGVVPASLLGIASPLCMYGTIPIAASFAGKGMAEDWIAAFVMSSILLNPQLLFYSAALGVQALFIRFVICFLCGIAAGLCVKLFFKNKPFFTFTKFETAVNNGAVTGRTVVSKGSPFTAGANLLLCYLKNFGRNIKATGLYFLAGIVLSALFQRYVPQEAFGKLFGGNKGFGVLMAATIGVPLYVCGGGTIPLLQAWLSNGMTIGSAASFMITGPATKITNLGALKIVLGIKHFAFYWLFAIAFALLSGLALDYIFLRI
jgi:uncharacterized membrane protein YraQ (UPF0718 family)